MDFNLVKEQSNTLFKELHVTHEKFYELWVNNILFTWRWWIAVGLIILPWILWLLIRKKKSADRLLYAGLFIMVSSSALDMSGIAMNLWCYPINVFPLMPEFIPFDICALPVATMIFIQFFPKVNAFIKAALYAMLGSLVFQPLMAWVGLYENLGWKHYYSLPILFILYIVANYLSNKNNFDEIKDSKMNFINNR